jgi:ADP-dependent phosphofructokinase/glucokinase
MCRRHARGYRGPHGFRRLSREEWLRRLEEYQRDLEEEIADVADLIRRLKEDKPAEPATA